MSTTKLLEERKRLKSSKPRFLRDMFGKRMRIPSTWRKPRGTRNKVAINSAGRRAVPNKGYKMSDAVRHLTPEGLKVILVANLAELERVDAKKEAIFIRASVGLKKKIEIIKKAAEKKIKVLNFRDAAKYVDEKLAKRNQDIKEKQKKKATIAEKVKEEEKNQKAEERKEEKKSETKLEDAIEAETAEEKKKEDKAEQDKLLTKPR